MEKSIFPRLSDSVHIISTQSLILFSDEKNSMNCSFLPPPPSPLTQNKVSIQVSIYITGDLAFQANILGREAMSGQHCMMCKLVVKSSTNTDSLPWTFPDLVQIGEDLCTGGVMGVKQKPWWPFLKFEHLVMVPLLHCMIGVGNNLLNKFCDGVNKFIENKSIRQITIQRALTNYDLIVLETVKRRDDFDLSLEGKKLKSLQAKVASRKRKRKNKNLEAATHNVLDADILRIEYELKPPLAV